MCLEKCKPCSLLYIFIYFYAFSDDICLKRVDFQLDAIIFQALKAKKQLRKPENWQDFESLCKKLWGEIWECKEIKKNGRSGQSQNGVDVYGVPKGEKYYFGIQCKGKDEYTHKKLSKKEVDRELELAKKFKPTLKKFYFATTANKDAEIAEYVRFKDIENRENGLFEVHLFSWEDIVDLIDENIETHDWYLGLNQYKVNADISISFENKNSKLIGMVPFCHEYINYVQRVRSKPRSKSWDLSTYRFSPPPSTIPKGKINLSYFGFKILMKNVGNSSIENPQLVLRAFGDFLDINDDNYESILKPVRSVSDIEIHKQERKIVINPLRKGFALDENYITKMIYIKPKMEGSVVELKWKFISNNCKKEGALSLRIETEIIKKESNEYVDSLTEVRVEESVGDFYEE
jgi:hypothetical protein